jgi:hypothetical protein
MNTLKSIITNKKFQLFSALIFGALFFGVAEAQAVGWDAKPGTVGESVSWYGAGNACGAAQSGNTRMTMLIDWQDIPFSSSGYYVDYKRTYPFSDTTTQDWIWNKYIPDQNTRNIITDGSDFADSPWDGGVNGNTRDLEAGYAYYVRVYNVQNATHYNVPGFVNIPVCGINSFPTQPTIGNAPACFGQNGYAGSNINWGGRYDERLGYYVDISTDNFATWYAKAVGVTYSTDFTGFNGYMGVSGLLTLQPSTTYYVRVFSGGNGHSSTRTFTTPAECPKPVCNSASPLSYTVPYGTNNHTVSIQTTNASYISVVFYPQGQIGSAIWIGGINAGGGVWNATINLASFGTIYGQYIATPYVSNANWTGLICSSTNGSFQNPDFIRQSPQPPGCSAAGPINANVPFGSTSHTINVSTVYATAVNVAVYPQSGGVTQWFAGTPLGGGNYSANVDLTLFGGTYGQFIVDIYMNNADYTNVGCGIHPNFVRQALATPACTGAGPDGLITYNDLGSHNIDVSGVTDTTAVNIAIWSDLNGQDDLIWYSATNIGGGVWRLSSAAYNYGSHPGYSPISVHVYMNNTQVTNQFCDTANFERQQRPPATLSAPVPNIGGANCVNGAYTVDLSWIGQARPTGQPIYTGYIVDASTDSGFSGWWNKTVGTTTTTTQAGTGFGPYSGVSGLLTLSPSTTYYFRVYNDSHSNTVSINVPKCGTVSVELDNQAGTWTLNHQESSFTLNGTGTQLNITVPSGTYTLTAHPLAGYNSVVAPALVTVP